MAALPDQTKTRRKAGDSDGQVIADRQISTNDRRFKNRRKRISGQKEPTIFTCEPRRSEGIPAAGLKGDMEPMTFKIPGWPRPQPRPRTFEDRTGRTVTTSNFKADVRAWKKHCGWYAKKYWGREPIPEGIYLKVGFMFYLPRPAKCKWRFPVYPSSGDLSNIIKSTEDALNKIIWHDDRFIVAYGTTFKAWCQPGQEPGLLIAIEEV